MYVGLVKIRLIAKQLKMPHGHPSVSQILLHCANYLSIKLIGPSVWTWGVCVNEIWKWNSTETEFRVENHMRRCWKTTRRSENDNTPQPLDQSMNSPFMNQQVRNCRSFTFTHYLADVFAMHCDPRASPLCVQHCIQLTSLSFQVNRPSYS